MLNIRINIFYIIQISKPLKTSSPGSFTIQRLAQFKDKKEQAKLGVPHSRIQVDLSFNLQAGTCQILNFPRNPRQSQRFQGTELNWGGDTAQKKCIPGGGDTAHVLLKGCQ